MSFAPEPAFSHGTAAKTAVLICNLGTPDEPTPKAVRRYLAEFLSDPRVVEIPRLLWWPILHAIVLRVRPAKSARKYARIWMKEGSPLKVWTEKQALLLAGYLGQRGQPVLVRHAMRYGQPSIAGALDALRAEGAERVLVLPLYPQYAAATTASVGDAVAAWMKRRRNLPELRFVKHWHDDPGYIGALARRVSDHWMTHGRPDRLVLSFHGLPKRSLTLGDPYHCECLKTGAAPHRAAEAARGERGRHLPEPLRQGRVAEALHRADPDRAWRSRAWPGSTCSAPASSPIAWRRSRRSTWRRGPRSWRPAARSSATSPASTTSTRGSLRWPASRCGTCRAGSSRPPTATARRRSSSNACERSPQAPDPDTALGFGRLRPDPRPR